MPSQYGSTLFAFSFIAIIACDAEGDICAFPQHVTYLFFTKSEFQIERLDIVYPCTHRAGQVVLRYCRQGHVYNYYS